LTRLTDNAGDLHALFELEGATNDRLLGEAGVLPGISVRELVFGIPYAHVVNAAFTHANPLGGRFNGPERGAWYAGFARETSECEIAYHRGKELQEVRWMELEAFSYVDFLADFRCAFHDLRSDTQFRNCLNPNNYKTSQRLAAELRRRVVRPVALRGIPSQARQSLGEREQAEHAPFGQRHRVHATRAAVEEGADVLVHSVVDKQVDSRFIELLKHKGTILCPTLVVFERYGRTFANKLNLTPEEKAWGNPEVIASLDVTKLPQEQLPERIKTALANPDASLDRIKKTYDVALKNLKTLEDAGVIIAAGTDAGNIGTIHGPALFREFQLMKEAGLTPMQILQCATTNAAKLFGGETGAHIGWIKKGGFADLVILKSNPVEDIARASDIDTVVKNGALYPADQLLKSPQ